MALRGGRGALAQEVLAPGKCAREGCFATPTPPRSHLAAHENARQHAAPHSPSMLSRRVLLVPRDALRVLPRVFLHSMLLDPEAES